MFRSKFATIYERENDSERKSRWTESTAILKIMDDSQMKIRPQCKQYADSYYAEHKAPGASLSGAKEARAARIMNQIQDQEFFKESEGFLYGPRITLRSCEYPKINTFSLSKTLNAFLSNQLLKLVGKIARKKN